MAADAQETSKAAKAVAGDKKGAPKESKDGKDGKDGKDSKDSKANGSGEVYNINDLEKDGKELKIAPETQKLNWKLNTSPTSLGEADTLKKPLTTPMVKKIDLKFPTGIEVTARNMKGVTIKDALDAIYKQFKKRADDELDDPILAGFEWDKTVSWTSLMVHQKKEGAPASKKSKKKEEE